MSDQLGLLQAIIENPDDDSHRLVLADWLDDHNETLQAELIRTQCSLTRLLLPADGPPFHRVPFTTEYQAAGGACEVMGLIPRLRDALLVPFACLVPFLGEADEDPAGVLGTAFGFWVRRGLIEGMTVYGGQTAALLARDADRIMARVPLRHLRISRFPDRAADRNYEGQAEALRVPTLRMLLEQGFVSRLATLDLRELDLGNQGARCLMRYRERLNLQRLYFDRNNISPEVGDELRQRFGGVLEMSWLNADEIPF